MTAHAPQTAISTSSASSSSCTPHFSLPPYSPGKGLVTKDAAPPTLLSACDLRSTLLGVFDVDDDGAGAVTSSARGEGVEGAEVIPRPR